MSLQEELEQSGNWLFRWRSYLPLLFLPSIAVAIHHAPLAASPILDGLWLATCLCSALVGLAIRVHCVGHAPPGTSGRNTKLQIAKVLNTTGLYSVLRHPLYLGNFFIALGLVALPGNGYLVATFILAFCVYYERIMYSEEAFLRRTFGDHFTAWAKKTPAFVPRLRQWIPPARRFDAAKAFERECAAMMVIVIGFTSICGARHAHVTGKWTLSTPWLLFGFAGGLVYLVARIQKHRSRSVPHVSSEAKERVVHSEWQGGGGPLPQ